MTCAGIYPVYTALGCVAIIYIVYFVSRINSSPLPPWHVDTIFFLRGMEGWKESIKKCHSLHQKFERSRKLLIMFNKFSFT